MVSQEKKSRNEYFLPIGCFSLTLSAALIVTTIVILLPFISRKLGLEHYLLFYPLNALFSNEPVKSSTEATAILSLSVAIIGAISTITVLATGLFSIFSSVQSRRELERLKEDIKNTTNQHEIISRSISKEATKLQKFRNIQKEVITLEKNFKARSEKIKEITKFDTLILTETFTHLLDDFQKSFSNKFSPKDLFERSEKKCRHYLSLMQQTNELLNADDLKSAESSLIFFSEGHDSLFIGVIDSKILLEKVKPSFSQDIDLLNRLYQVRGIIQKAIESTKTKQIQ